METRIAMLGGGIGSAAMLFSQAGRWSSGKKGQHFREERPLRAVSFHYGQRNAKAQLEAAKNMAEALEVPWSKIKLPNLVGSGLPGEPVPGLHIATSSVAGNLVHRSGGGEVIYGFVEDDQDRVPECHPSFLGPLTRALQLGGLEAHLSAPHVAFRKAQLLKIYWEHPRFQEAVRLSYSCAVGKVFPCGKCSSCNERRSAFMEAKILDPDLGRG